MNRAMKQQKGFTLIELLIVVAIIGLLATLAIVSLTSAQQRARDTKRVADVKAIQTALELYWNGAGNANYPAVGANWDALGNDLAAYMSSMPVDPDHDDGVAYVYIVEPTNRDQYFLGADLENTSHSALDGDTDTNPAGATWHYLDSVGGRDVTGAYAGFNCTDGNGIYCVEGDSTI